MTTLTRDDVRQIRADLTSAMQTVAKKYGMYFSLGTIRFDSFNGTMRATLQGTKVGLPGQQTAEPDRTANPLVGAALKAAGIDPMKTFHNTRVGEFKVIDYVPRRHKYPILIRNTSGKTFKVTVEYVKMSKEII